MRERDERSETGAEELLTVSHLTGVAPRSEKDVNMFEAETTEGYKICLEQLNAATVLHTLRVPPGNQLEALTYDRQGQHSIRVNDQWRVCFVWRDGDAYDVEIVDYH